MATSSLVMPVSKSRRIEGTAFDWLMILTAVWFVSGLFIDGWAHTHGRVDQSFFTPWHAIFYSGFMAVALVIGGAYVINHSRGYSWEESIPTGYRLSLVGVVIFAFGGVFDLIWHTLFGIEVDFQALVSPSHLILALGLFLIVGGPLRAAWQRPIPRIKTPNLLMMLPMLLSATFTYSVMTFITFPLHPLVNQRVRDIVDPKTYPFQMGQQVTVAGAMLQAGLLVGLILILTRRWKLPFGSLTLILTLNMLGLQMLGNDWAIVGVAAVTGLLADLFILRFDPSTDHLFWLRVFAFALPASLFLLYFLFVLVTHGIPWTIHVWLGVAALAGIIGVLASFVFYMPGWAQLPVGTNADSA